MSGSRTTRSSGSRVPRLTTKIITQRDEEEERQPDDARQQQDSRCDEPADRSTLANARGSAGARGRAPRASSATKLCHAREVLVADVLPEVEQLRAACRRAPGRGSRRGRPGSPGRCRPWRRRSGPCSPMKFVLSALTCASSRWLMNRCAAIGCLRAREDRHRVRAAHRALLGDVEHRRSRCSWIR